MIREKKILIDIDGVIAAFGEHFINYLGFEDKSQPTKWEDKRFVENIHKVDNDSNFWLTIPRLVEPSDIKFKISGYCTARNISKKVTELWLRNNGFPEAPVYSVGLGKSKVEILKEVGCDLFIDDSESNFKEINEAGIKCHLMTRSHNLNVDTPLRVDSLDEFSIFTKTNILILGYKEHGKSTLSDIICKYTNLSSEDSSKSAAKIFIYDKLKNKYGYKSFKECYEDRRNKRKEWYDLIVDYNKYDKCRLAKNIIKENNIYVGMRRTDEVINCNEIGLFDYIVGIYDPRKEHESKDSCDIDIFKYSDFTIFNNGDLSDLEKKVKKIFKKSL
jgi:uncharacterized HAD superfamily protein